MFFCLSMFVVMYFPQGFSLEPGFSQMSWAFPTSEEQNLPKVPKFKEFQGIVDGKVQETDKERLVATQMA